MSDDQAAEGVGPMGASDTSGASSTGSPLVCPSCHQVDCVRRVQSVVAEGTSTVGGRESRTRLAEQFYMAPTWSRPLFGPDWGGFILLSFLLGFSYTLIGFASAIFGNAVAAQFFVPMAGGRPSIPLGVAVGLFLALIVWSIRGAIQSQCVPDQGPLWDAVYACWKKLLYCGRCHGVFAPGNSGVSPVDRMGDSIAAWLMDGARHLVAERERERERERLARAERGQATGPAEASSGWGRPRVAGLYPRSAGKVLEMGQIQH